MITNHNFDCGILRHGWRIPVRATPVPFNTVPFHNNTAITNNIPIPISVVHNINVNNPNYYCIRQSRQLVPNNVPVYPVDPSCLHVPTSLTSTTTNHLYQADNVFRFGSNCHCQRCTTEDYISHNCNMNINSNNFNPNVNCSRHYPNFNGQFEFESHPQTMTNMNIQYQPQPQQTEIRNLNNANCNFGDMPQFLQSNNRINVAHPEPSPNSSVTPPLEHTVTKRRMNTRKCKYCNKCFATRHELVRHVRTHTGERPFQCHICHKRFVQRQHLVTHLRTVHSSERPFKCPDPDCLKQFKAKGNLKKHIQFMHNKNIQLLPCSQCNKRFKRKGGLKSHLKKTHRCNDDIVDRVLDGIMEKVNKTK